MDKPILLLDVDGVLCPFSRTQLRNEYPGFEYDPENYVYTSMTLAGYVYDLMDHFDIHWCTGWVGHANDLGKRMGLPSFPWVNFDQSREQDPHWKWGAIREYIAQHDNRPYAFLDDEITDEAISFVKACGEPHASALWLPTLCDEGLTLGHVHRLTKWANELPVSA